MRQTLGDPAVQLLLHGLLAWIFARSAIHKWREPAAFRSALRAYAILPEGRVGFVAAGLAVLETAVAVGLLVPVAGPWPAWIGALLLALYGAAMAAAWARGLRDIDCGCGAPGAGRPIGPDLMVRNALLALLSCAAALPSGARALGWLDGATVLSSWIALVVLLEAIDQGLRQLDGMRSLATSRGGTPG